MFSHIFIGVRDFDASFAFYAALAELLGLELKFREDDRPWAGWKQPSADRPLLLIGPPFDGAPAQPGNGAMTAFLAHSRAQVDAVHAAALQLGGSDAGGPGLRPHYHADYYGAYFRDPDGNKLAVACHTPAR